ncbi:MAG: hypothetical protein IJC25_05985 [Clostridia bacterium]|nr:hypothetical protein [Clostridia bacterium]
MNHQNLSASGRFRLTLCRADNGRPIRQLDVCNRLTEFHRSFRNALLTGSVDGYSLGDLQLKYFAFGDGVSEASAKDVGLENERFRKQITSISLQDGAVRSICNLGAGEANFHITEIGVFGGPDATAELGSGRLLGRVNVNVDKNENLVLNVVRIDSTDI